MRFHGLVQGPIDNKLMWRQSSKPFERISHAENSRWTHEHRKHKKRTVVKVFKIDKSFFLLLYPIHMYIVYCVCTLGEYMAITLRIRITFVYVSNTNFRMGQGTNCSREPKILPQILHNALFTPTWEWFFFLFVSSIDNISGTDGSANNHIYFSFIRYFDATISSVKTC